MLDRAAEAKAIAADADLPFVSVVMPVLDEACFIARSLGAILEQDYPAQRMEVIVADGMSTDGTRRIVASMQGRHLNVRLADNCKGTASAALNTALEQARGEVIMRVDGHCEIESGYVRRCVEYLQSRSVDAVGGGCRAVGDTLVAGAIAAAMSSRFGVGDAAFRTARNRTMLVDTIFPPAYTRSIVERAGPFDEELVRDQDDEYNYRLRKLGAKLLMAGDLETRYHCRGSLGQLWQQYFQYGFWKVRVMQKHPRQMRPRQFAPPILAAFLLGLAPLAFPSRACRAVLGLVVGVYSAANLAASLWCASRTRWRHAPILPLGFGVLHFGYGLGFLCGLLRFWTRWGNQGSA